MDEHAVRDDLYHIDQEYDTDEQKGLPEGLLVFRAVQDIAYAQHMLQKDDPLVAEAVVKEIDHVSGAGLKEEFPHEELVAQYFFHACSPPSGEASSGSDRAR